MSRMTEADERELALLREQAEVRVGRRMVRFNLDPQTLVTVLGIPEDVWVEGVRQSSTSNGFELFVSGKRFEPVEPGHEVPLIYPKFTMEPNGRVSVSFDD